MNPRDTQIIPNHSKGTGSDEVQVCTDMVSGNVVSQQRSWEPESLVNVWAGKGGCTDSEMGMSGDCSSRQGLVTGVAAEDFGQDAVR
jgi:hypothetical protein